MQKITFIDAVNAYKAANNAEPTHEQLVSFTAGKWLQPEGSCTQCFLSTQHQVCP